jgi:uncharacterized cupin superfamily protein
MARPKSIVASSQVPVEEEKRGEKFCARRRRLGTAAGGEKLGCSLFDLPPGKAAFPSHRHLANEEAVYVLEGEGVLRLDDSEHALGAGDYISFRADTEAHQIVNRSRAPLRFLAISTMINPEVVIYPDSQKVGVRSRPPDSAPGRRPVIATYRLSSEVDYWEGEE